MRQTLSHRFPAFIGKDPRVLILGSFPSVKSRESSFFYMHPRNRFYLVLSDLFGEDFYSCDIKEKKRLLEKYHIALYDVIETCSIRGSEDASIRDVVPADIVSIVKLHSIRKIFLNGRKAYDLFCKYHRELLPMAVLLPSTSPANATRKKEDLVEEWEKIAVFCKD